MPENQLMEENFPSSGMTDGIVTFVLVRDDDEISTFEIATLYPRVSGDGRRIWYDIELGAHGRK